MKKLCRDCGETKDESEFYRRLGGRQPYSYCKPCSHERVVRWRHGLGKGDYEAMLLAQGGVCAICREQPAPGMRFERYAVDHCHKTGAVRGLLCSPCNRALGLFKDRADVLERAATYLKGEKIFV